MLTGNLHFSRHGTDPSHVRVSSGPAFLATACRQAARLERLRADGAGAQDLLELAGTPALQPADRHQGRGRRAQTEAGAIEQSATNLHAQGYAELARAVHGCPDRLRAMRLVHDSGRPIAHVPRDLGVGGVTAQVGPPGRATSLAGWLSSQERRMLRPDRKAFWDDGLW